MLVVDVGVPEEVGIGLGGALSWGRLGIGSGGRGGFGTDGACLKRCELAGGRGEVGIGVGIGKVRASRG